MCAESTVHATVQSNLQSTVSSSASVVIIVPRYQVALKEEEVQSLKHLEHFLGGHTIYFISPQSLIIPDARYPIQRFANHYFSSVKGFNQLMLSKEFYQAFARWDYVLQYQLDCLVFSDQLLQWCATGYDYIGPPWLRDQADPTKGLFAVGNGGFSLRKVTSSLRALDNAANFWQVWANAARLSQQGHDAKSRNFLRWLYRLYRQPRRFKRNEDGFWSYAAKLHEPTFTLPSAELALGFGFECAPEYCFQQNNQQLPFGCHAWARYNRTFWEPYLL
jgi:hypothetical protein